MRFIGLMGAKHAGKDTVGNMICEMLPGARRVAFADVLKRMALGIDPVIAITREDAGFYSDLDYRNSGLMGVDRERSTTFVRLSTLVYSDRIGWEKAKAIADVRRLLQRLGTEGGRECIDQNVWVKATFKQYVDPVIWEFTDGALANHGFAEPHFVFTDVRFPNEIEAVRNYGGELWRIDRDSVEDGDPHPSERAWREATPDKVINNHDGTLDELRVMVQAALELPV